MSEQGWTLVVVDQQQLSNQITSEMGEAFRSLIRDRCCLYFKDNELEKLYSSIQTRITALELDTPRDYFDVLTDKHNHKEWTTLLELLTIHHTFFFRNKPQFSALKQKVLPDLIERKRRDIPDHLQLTVWSAGCSTGQEPYSIAMAAAELIEDLDHWHIRIIGTDISRPALQTAQQGIYPAKSVKDLDESVISRHFNVIHTGDKAPSFQVKDHIRALVEFNYLNLAEGFFPLDVDILFCRNVIIYFDTPTIYTLTEKFEQSLTDQGYLFIGHSETLPPRPSQLKMQSFQDGIYYQKINDITAEPKQKKEKPTSAKIKPTYPFDAARHTVSSGRSTSVETLLLDIEDAVRLNEYALAKELILQVQNTEPNNCEAEYWHAQIQMNRGAMAVAKQLLTNLTEKHPFFVPAYYLLGLVFVHEQDDGSALASFKRALYIDKHFVLARFALATTLRHQQQHQQARKEYKTLLKDIPSDVIESEIKYGNGLSYKMLVNICKKHSEGILG